MGELYNLAEYRSTKENYYHVQSVIDFGNMLDHLERHRDENDMSLLPIGLDTETYYEEDHSDEVYTKWIMGSRNNMPFGMSIFCSGKGFWLDSPLMLEKSRIFLDDPTYAWVLHNSKYDIFMLKNIGIEVKATCYDTMIMAQLIDEEMMLKSPNGGLVKSKALKNIGYHYFGADAKELEAMVKQAMAEIAKERGVNKSQVSYKDVSDKYPEIMKDYAIFDTELCYNIYPIFLEDIARQRLFEPMQIDMNATRDVIDIERTGVLVDLAKMEEDETKLIGIADNAAKNCYDLIGKSINLNSADELLEGMQAVGVDEWPKFNEDGSPDTSKKLLKKIKDDVNTETCSTFIENLLTYRKANKLLSTYINQIRDYVQHDGRVHCDFWISPSDYDTGSTVTGRMSSSNPNMQNIPKKPIKLIDAVGTEHVFNPRDYFVAEEDYIQVFMDYDQQEYRLLGHYSGDEKFKQIIHEGKDIHSGTASMLFKIPYDEVTDEQRADGKQINFALVYNLGNPQFAVSLGYDIDPDRARVGTQGYLYKQYQAFEIPPYSKYTTAQDVINSMPPDLDREIVDGVFYYLSAKYQEAIIAAKKAKDEYFEQFPKIKSFLNYVQKKAKKYLWVKTWTGRRRHLKSPDYAYKAGNAVIQGGCGDIMKVKLHELGIYIRENGLKSRLILSVHDEVGFLVHKSEIEHIPMFKEILEDLPMFSVPITVGMDYATKWGTKTGFTDISELNVG